MRQASHVSQWLLERLDRAIRALTSVVATGHLLDPSDGQAGAVARHHVACPPGADFKQVLRDFASLCVPGVELLAGTDAAPQLVAGVAHGPSLHEQLQPMA